MTEDKPKLISLHTTPSQESLDAVSFADSLSSIGCSMRNYFISLFSKASNHEPLTSLAPSDDDLQDENGTSNSHQNEDNTHEDIKSDPKTIENENSNENNTNTENLTEPPSESKPKDFNFTSSISHFLNDKFNIRKRLSSLADLVVPDFSPDPAMFRYSSSSDFGDLFGSKRGGEKFIDLYSIDDATNMIRNSPAGPALDKMGFHDWFIQFDLSDCFVHYAYLKSRSIADDSKFLGMLIIQKGDFKLKSPIANPAQSNSNGNGFDFVHENFPTDANILNIRWFALQNPLAHFSSRKPRLPGQRFPGTGLARIFFSIFCKQALQNKRDGIVNMPEHFHNAFLYEGFQFLNPDDEGEFQKMKADLREDIEQRGLAAVSWAIYLGFLRKGDNVSKWDPQEQLFPLSHKMQKYFHLSGYDDIVKSKLQQTEKYYIKWDEAESYCLSAIIEISSEDTHYTSKS